MHWEGEGLGVGMGTNRRETSGYSQSVITFVHILSCSHPPTLPVGTLQPQRCGVCEHVMPCMKLGSTAHL